MAHGMGFVEWVQVHRQRRLKIAKMTWKTKSVVAGVDASRDAVQMVSECCISCWMADRCKETFWDVFCET